MSQNQPRRIIMYYCDMKKCEHCDVRDGIAEKTNWYCKHTSDIHHSVNYKNQPPLKTIEKNFTRRESGNGEIWIEGKEDQDGLS